MLSEGHFKSNKWRKRLQNLFYHRTFIFGYYLTYNNTIMRIALTRFLLLSGLFATVMSCQKQLDKDVLPGQLSATNQATTTSGNEWSSNPYKLNVVYFVPNDLDTLANYKRRISGILLQFQRFVADNMQREGYGRKSFGLDLQSSSIINIITIRGKLGKASYKYDDGSGNVLSEVNAYFNANPGSKKSDHTLYILPTFFEQTNPGYGGYGPPFYGLGRNCFALDYATMDTSYLGQSGSNGNLATVWIGGLAHELGHGLNLPHEHQLKITNASLGMALMSSGNSTYGVTPTFLTPGSCAILNNSQTLSTTTRTDWYATTSDIELLKLKTEVVSNTVYISGKYNNPNSTAVNKIVAWHDAKPYGGNLDYDAVVWAANPIGSDSFRFACPLNEFFNTTDTTQLRISFLLPNGNRSTVSFLYTFTSNVPNVISLNSTQNPLVSGSYYKLVSALNGTSVLDVTDYGTVDGTKVQLWAGNGSIAQKWKATSVGNGYYKLQPQNAPTKTLEAKDGYSTNGTQIQIWTDNSTNAQKWKLSLTGISFAGKSYYSLVSGLCDLRVLDVNNAVSANGTKIQLWDKNTSPAQQWELVPQ